MRSGRYLLSLVFLMALMQGLRATHNRAGEISYTRIAPTTATVGGLVVDVYRYRITIIKYTDYGIGIADRCVDTLYFGDGDRGVAPRVNGPFNNCCAPFAGAQIPCGDLIVNDPTKNYRVNKSIYVIEHTYPGPGNYLIRSYDPNRNAGVKNIPNSVSQPFYVESWLVINSFSGANSSPVLTNAPIDKACIGQCFMHNPGAYDADGDSLSYELTTSRGQGGVTVTGYWYPNAYGGTYSINPINGWLSWCTPQDQGEYNIAFIVKEWRKNTNGVRQLIGYVLRDMQVIVAACPKENPPTIKVPQDTCVEAGTLIDKTIVVSDPDNGDILTLTSSDGAFVAPLPIATMSNTSGQVTSANGGSLAVKFRWQTSCSHIREQPYYTTFKAQDNGAIVAQVAFNTYAIRVVPPTVKNVTVVPNGSTMKVSWSLSTCSPTNNPILAYRIYRKNDCAPYVPDPCAINIPTASGYVKVGEVDPKTNTFIDNNNGDGLVVGQNYGYIVVAFYSDGTQTFASQQICGALRRDVPVILNVDVLTTGVANGSIKIRWAPPLTTPGNFDSIAYPGPYKYILKHLNASGTYDEIFTSTNTTLLQLATSFTQTAINTAQKSHEYIVEFYSGKVSIGSSQRATSVFLSTTPADRKIDLSWSAKTPWNNSSYTIKRKDPGSTTYSTIATTSATTYTDKNHVVNRATYCYVVTSQGAYSDVSIEHPLINNSEESCATAKDLTPPCSPTLNIDADCPNQYVRLSWQDVRSICDESDDVVKYYLFYKPTLTDEYIMVDSLNLTQSTGYVPSGLGFSGCYAIQAKDSSANLSRLSQDFCIDNCPIFELPNIFTPNGDSINDYFKAIRVRQIKEIDLNVFDRWGNLVYKTKDPYFKWNGVSQFSKREISEGTFFYICDVFEPRLRGIVKRTLKGYVEMQK
jgi:gliding motility-associated-like protein